MVIRRLMATDSREEISNIYEQSRKYAYKGIIAQSYLDSIPKGHWCHPFDKQLRELQYVYFID